MPWADSVKAYRETHKPPLTQEALAHALRVSVTTVSRVEREKCHPSPMLQEKLVALGLHP